MPLPPVDIDRLLPIEQDRILSNKNSYPQIASIIESKMDKMFLTDEQIEDLNFICYKLQKGSITLDKAVLKLRAGGFYDWATLAFIIFMFSLQQGNSFQNVPLPHMDPMGWASGKYNSPKAGPSRSPTGLHMWMGLKMEKPVSIPHLQYSGMTSSEKRRLPDLRDASIQVDGYHRLDLKFWQLVFKTPQHGEVQGLFKDETGNTPKTEANAIALCDSLMDMPNRKKIVWYTNGQYQEGTPCGCDSVNLFDKDRGVITVYQKQPDGSYLFLTTCQLTEMELDHFLKTLNGNFVTERVLKKQR